MAVSVSHVEPRGTTMGPSFFPQVDRTLAQPLLGKRSPATPSPPPTPHLPSGKTPASKGAGQGGWGAGLLRESRRFLFLILKKIETLKLGFKNCGVF